MSKLRQHITELNFHQGFKLKIKQNLNVDMKWCINVSRLKMTVVISILEKLIGKYQKGLLITIRETNIHIFYNMQKIKNTHMFKETVIIGLKMKKVSLYILHQRSRC